jgi:multiple sugar transport system permease protein
VKTRGYTDRLPALAFLLPNFLGFFVFAAGPVLFSLVASGTDWTLTRPGDMHWVGLANYRELLGDRAFWTYFVNTLYLMLGIPISIAGSLALALLLNRGLRGVVVYRTLFYLPHFTSGVALFVLWKALYNPEFGPINAGLEWVADGLGFPNFEGPRWLISVRNLLGLEVERVGFSARQFGLGAREAIVIMGIWIGIGGNNMLLYVAALSNVPQDLLEAAQMDGAGRWARFAHIVWPQLAPTTFFILIMSVIGGLQGGFEQARVMTGGGPSGTTTTLAYHIYQISFEQFQIGRASAVAWMLFAMVFALTMLVWRFGSRAVNE